MNASQFSSFLKGIHKTPLPVLDKTIPLSQYVFIDLSESNPDLQHHHLTTSNDWEQYINHHCKKHQAQVAYGGYLEKRQLYARSEHFKSPHSDERNIHLGLDLWLSAGSKVYAPLDGRIHSFANNTLWGDYGPTLIVQHEYQGQTFYTLFGHLSLESLTGWRVGQNIKAGEPIATLGEASVNGDYAPHLHLQIIRDIGNYFGDYPGVCSANTLSFYKDNCPDPNLLLKLY